MLHSLVALQVAAFVAQLLLAAWDQNVVVDYLGLSRRGLDQAFAWQFFTAPFLVHTVWQFLANVLFLYLIGRDVEVIIGQRRFLFLYALGMVAGELGHLFLMPETTVLFAATGGVAAVVAAYATLLPQLEVSGRLFFVIPVRFKTRTLMQWAVIGAAILFFWDRTGVVGHSAFLGGAAAGWFYTHLLGFGGTSFWQRFFRRRAEERYRLQTMTSSQFLREEIDPILDKVAARGLRSLSRRERRLLLQARAKILLEREA